MGGKLVKQSARRLPMHPFITFCRPGHISPKQPPKPKQAAQQQQQQQRRQESDDDEAHEEAYEQRLRQRCSQHYVRLPTFSHLQAQLALGA